MLPFKTKVHQFIMMILVDQISDGIYFKTALPYSDAN